MTPTVGGPINETFFQMHVMSILSDLPINLMFLFSYDSTVQAALSSGSNVHVILDVVSSTHLFNELV